MQYFFETSIKFKIITCIYAILFWVTFNFLTGLITGDKSLDDNYFLLLIVLLHAGFLSSYKMKFNRGNITTYQLGMVTNSIDLFKSDKVIDEGKRLVIHYPNDSRFPIKLSRFDDVAINTIKETVKPQLGKIDKDIVVEKDICIEKKTEKLKPSNAYEIFVGAIFLGISITALLTDVIYFPSRGGFIRLSESPYGFYIILSFLSIIGVYMVIDGVLGRWKSSDT